jgi:AraC-like DNA-binding protein
MKAISQADAVRAERLAVRDEVSFWRDPRWDDLECLHATFVQHEYAPHTHETFVIGVIEDGVEYYRLRGVERRAVAGDIVIVHPEELHDGRPGDAGYRYRMFYPSADLIEGIWAEVTERPGTPVGFRLPEFRDLEVYRLLSGAHRVMQHARDSLGRDEAFLRAASLILARYGDAGGTPIRAGREDRAVARVCDYAEAHLDEALDLDTLSAIAGFSRYRLIRSFRRAKGITPHAWVTARRISRAERLLARGILPVQAALESGFCDQAHLTRAFKAVKGVTPARYRAAFLQ